MLYFTLVQIPIVCAACWFLYHVYLTMFRVWVHMPFLTWTVFLLACRQRCDCYQQVPVYKRITKSQDQERDAQELLLQLTDPSSEYNARPPSCRPSHDLTFSHFYWAPVDLRSDTLPTYLETILYLLIGLSMADLWHEAGQAPRFYEWEALQFGFRNILSMLAVCLLDQAQRAKKLSRIMYEEQDECSLLALPPELRNKVQQ